LEAFQLVSVAVISAKAVSTVILLLKTAVVTMVGLSSIQVWK
jgi:hypothetical protein